MQIIETTTHAEAARDVIVPMLATAILQKGEARLLVSGGSSPEPLFGLLSDADIDWSKVKIGLVDERIDPGNRNAKMVTGKLLTGKAAEACFVPMIKPSPRKDAREPNTEAYREEMIPADVCILGMGTDGHTASWFPGSVDLQKVLSDSANPLLPIVGVNTEGCEGNGGFDLRLTLTKKAVLASGNIVLFIPGGEKREVFFGDEVGEDGTEELPAHMLRELPNVTVICDPAPAPS